MAERYITNQFIKCHDGLFYGVIDLNFEIRNHEYYRTNERNTS